MEKHFRIIELPTHQVLLTKDFDDDNESTPLLTVTFFLDGVKVCQKLGYEDTNKRDDSFNDFKDEHAQLMLNSTLEMLNPKKEEFVDDGITEVDFKEELPVENITSKEWPESSNIAKTEYDSKERVLIVTFKGNGKKYAYHDFLEKDWQKVLNAESIGKHINSEVKGVHASQPI